jgi:hypothetical protein
MKRRALLSCLIALMTLVAPFSSVKGALLALGQSDGVVTGGIGMSRADWEAVHGLGDATQNYVVYEDGAVYVQFRGDVVLYLEYGYLEPGVPLAEADALVWELIPSDARLIESFAAPATTAGPIGLYTRRYTSRALATQVPEFGDNVTGSILVVYSETPAPDRFEPNVARVSISVGFAP